MGNKSRQKNHGPGFMRQSADSHMAFPHDIGSQSRFHELATCQVAPQAPRGDATGPGILQIVPH